MNKLTLMTLAVLLAACPNKPPKDACDAVDCDEGFVCQDGECVASGGGGGATAGGTGGGSTAGGTGGGSTAGGTGGESGGGTGGASGGGTGGASGGGSGGASGGGSGGASGGGSGGAAGGGSGGGAPQVCTPLQTQPCYEGAPGTEGFGPCQAGTRTCNAGGTAWGNCLNQVVPVPEVCGNGIDDNCNGIPDDDLDEDGDGYTRCQGDCCDNLTECVNPVAINPGAYDYFGDNIDDDCDGTPDNPTVSCDDAIASNTTDATNYARAIELCNFTATGNWGVISAALTRTNGTTASDALAKAVRPRFGTNGWPQKGFSLAVLSSGRAASAPDGVNDTNPAYTVGDSTTHSSNHGLPVGWPPGGTLPTAPGCPQIGNDINDSSMLSLQVKVPTNAHAFSVRAQFFSYEFPEWVCSQYNDFFVALLTSTYSGSTPANPADGNLAVYTNPQNGQQYPVGVNLAKGNTGLFRQCVNNTTIGCSGSGANETITTCQNVDYLVGTGFGAASSSCSNTNPQTTEGGGTGWLTISGNVVPGETITLRFAVWDTSDNALDSTVVLDDFRWIPYNVEAGTKL